MGYTAGDIPREVMIIKSTLLPVGFIKIFMAIAVKLAMTSRMIHHLTAIS